MDKKKQQPIKARLLKAMEASIRETGADGLKVRPGAAAADCAVGSIYKSFSNLEAAADLLIANVYERLRSALTALHQTPQAPQALKDHAIALSAAYPAFARQ